MFRSGASIVEIAFKEKVAPSTVSIQLHRLGINIKMGQHHVEQLPLKYPSEFVNLINQGPDKIIGFVKDRVWGIGVTNDGRQQVHSFCEFIRLHQQGVGVKEIARRLGLHRSTVAEWREGTDQPYLIRALNDTLPLTPMPGWKLLPLQLVSGGNDPSAWIRVPETIRSYIDILGVVSQLKPLEETYLRAEKFGFTRTQIGSMKPEFFAYLLGIMVGDSGKLGGAQNRYASMNLDLQLTLKHSSNERLGEFTRICSNTLGLEMDRKADKQPTGATAVGKNPSPAYRWTSVRSPLFAWMFSVGLGLGWEETTTTNQLRMGWILDTPSKFRLRFVQGAADSDGCVKRYEVEIASVPNAQLFTDILRSLGMTTAHVSYEGGEPLKTMVNRKQALTLPIFNEFVKSYRFQKMTNQIQP